MDEFFDGLDLGTDAGRDDAITALYVGILGRAPDPEGLAFWKGQLDNATGSKAEKISAIAESFRVGADGDFANPYTGDAAAVLSAESSDDVTDAQVQAFVNQVYNNAFARDFEPAGQDSAASWVEGIKEALDSEDGASIGNVLYAMLNSADSDNGLNAEKSDLETLQNKVTAGISFSDAVVAANQGQTVDFDPETDAGVTRDSVAEIVNAANSVNGEVGRNTDESPAQTVGANAGGSVTVSASDPDAEELTLGNALNADPLPDSYTIDPESEEVEAGGVDVAEAEAAFGVLNDASNTVDVIDLFTWTIADTLENLENVSPQAVLDGADSYTLTNEDTALGQLTSEQVALVEGAENTGDFTFTSGEPGTPVDAAETFTATDGEADTFNISIDSSSGQVIATDFTGDATIESFDSSEDNLNFVDVSGGNATAQSIADGTGLTITPNAFNNNTEFAFSPNADQETASLTVEGIAEANTDFISVSDSPAGGSGGGDSSGGSGSDGSSDGTPVDAAETVTATDGEADTFAISIDSSSGQVIATDFTGDATIESFDSSEDTLRFEDVSGGNATAQSIADGTGLTITPNAFNNNTEFAFSPNADQETASLTVEGIAEASTDFIEIA